TDTASTDIGDQILFSDDGPSADIVAATHEEVIDDVPTDVANTVTVDETDGVDAEDDDTTDAGVIALFSGVTDTSGDLVATEGAVQYAQGTAPLVTDTTDYGADDENTSAVFSLKVEGFTPAVEDDPQTPEDETAAAIGVDSGLDTTDGTDIYLYEENGLVVGRINGGDADGEAAFAIAIDSSDGTVSVAQYASVTNPTGGDSHDEVAGMSNNVLSAVVTATDGDGDTDTASTDIGDQILFSDDGPSAITPDDAYLVNQVSDPEESDTRPLDIDLDIDNNMGADQEGGTVKFNTETQHGVDSLLTANAGSEIYLYISGSGETLVGSTYNWEEELDPEAPTADYIIAEQSTTKVFTVELLSSEDPDNYTFTLHQQIDGGAGEFNTFEGTWSFSGTNKAFTYYTDESGNDLPSVLVTPTGVATSTNGTANEIGASGFGGGGGQDIGANEGVRVDFIDGVVTTVDDSKPYGGSGDTRHTFDGHVLVNGAQVTFTSSGSELDLSTVLISTHVDEDYSSPEDNIVGDYGGAIDTTIIAVEINGVEITTAAPDSRVTFNGDNTVEITEINDGDSVVVFTVGGMTTIEYTYVDGGELLDNSFSLGGFGASVFDPGAATDINFDIVLYDGDGDSVNIDDGISVHLSPEDHIIQDADVDGDGISLTVANNTSGTLVGNEADNILTGNTGEDIFWGNEGGDTFKAGQGDDTIKDYDRSEGDDLDISGVPDYDHLGDATGDPLGDLIVESEDGKAKLLLFDSGDIEIGSVTFDNVDFDTVDPTDLTSLLGDDDPDATDI
ncbi:DUF5801 repeats-in-toxin domain-containing protein, partial [Thermodesulfobacteriota bacterium]